jgi:hypothetical protein
MRLRSCKTRLNQYVVQVQAREGKLTSNTGEKLSGEALDLAIWERNEVVTFKKVKNALTE